MLRTFLHPRSSQLIRFASTGRAVHKVDPYTVAFDIGVPYISHLLREGDKDEATSITKRLSRDAGRFPLARVKEVMQLSTQQDPSRLDEVVDFFVTNIQVVSRIETVQNLQIECLLERGDVDKAFDKVVEWSRERKEVGCQFQLLADAFKRNDQEMVRKVYNLVLKIHGKNCAIVDLAFAMLMFGSSQHTVAANLLLQTANLQASPNKLKFYSQVAFRMEKPEIFIRMLLTLYKNQAIRLSDASDVIERLNFKYSNGHMYDEILAIEKELRGANFPFTSDMRTYFNKIAAHCDKEKSTARMMGSVRH